MANSNNLQATNNDKFLASSKAIDFVLMIIEFVVWKFLALTTSVTVYAFLDGTIQQYFATENLDIARAVTITAIYIMLDFGGTKLYKYWLQAKDIKLEDSEQEKSKKAFLNIIIILFIFRFVGTTFSTFLASPTISEFVVGDSKEDKYLNDISKKDSIQLAKSTLAINYSKELQNSHNKRTKAAKKEGKTLIDKAIKSGNKSQQKSYKNEKFSWIETNRYTQYQKSNKAYAKRIRTAMSEAAILLEREQALTRKAELAVNLTDNDTTYNKVINFLADKAKQEVIENKAKIQTTKSYIYLIDFFSAILGLFISYARNLRAKAGNQLAQKTIGGAIFNFFEQLYLKAVYKIESWLEFDFNKDGEIGAPTAAQPKTRPVIEIPSNEQFTPPYQAPTDQEFEERVAAALEKRFPKPKPILGFRPESTDNIPPTSQLDKPTPTAISTPIELPLSTPVSPPIIPEKTAEINKEVLAEIIKETAQKTADKISEQSAEIIKETAKVIAEKSADTLQKTADKIGEQSAAINRRIEKNGGETLRQFAADSKEIAINTSTVAAEKTADRISEQSAEIIKETAKVIAEKSADTLQKTAEKIGEQSAAKTTEWIEVKRRIKPTAKGVKKSADSRTAVKLENRQIVRNEYKRLLKAGEKVSAAKIARNLGMKARTVSDHLVQIKAK